jgi:predicted MarR family transcription regulator
MERSDAKQPSWVFLTNHAHVLLCIVRDPDSRTRDIAEHVGITERATQRIVAELIAGGYLTRTKVGRRNHYEVNRHGHLRSAAFTDFEVGPLLDVLNTADGARRGGAGRTAEARRPPSAGRRSSGRR